PARARATRSSTATAPHTWRTPPGEGWSSSSRPRRESRPRLPFVGAVPRSLTMRSTVLTVCAAISTAALLPACGSVPPKASPSDPAGNFSEVSAGIYRGGRPDQPGVEVLAQMGVRTILDLEDDDE